MGILFDLACVRGLPESRAESLSQTTHRHTLELGQTLTTSRTYAAAVACAMMAIFALGAPARIAEVYHHRMRACASVCVRVCVSISRACYRVGGVV